MRIVLDAQQAQATYLDNEVVWVNSRLVDHLPVVKGASDPSIGFLVASPHIDTDRTFDLRPGHNRAGLNPDRRLFELIEFPYNDQKGIGDRRLSKQGVENQLWETMHYVPIMQTFRYVN